MGRGSTARTPEFGAACFCGIQRRRTFARPKNPNGRRDSRLGRAGRRNSAASIMHVQNGDGCSVCGGSEFHASAWSRWLARGRRLGHAEYHQRESIRAGHDDCREGGGFDFRQRSACTVRAGNWFLAARPESSDYSGNHYLASAAFHFERGLLGSGIPLLMADKIFLTRSS